MLLPKDSDCDVTCSIDLRAMLCLCWLSLFDEAQLLEPPVVVNDAVDQPQWAATLAQVVLSQGSGLHMKGEVGCWCDCAGMASEVLGMRPA